jgi:beta-glucanase (GH16 family)
MKTPCHERKVSLPLHLLGTCILLLSTPSLTCASWVDPDTPEEAQDTRPLAPEDDRQYSLVFSDEFNTDGRTFNDGHDPRWTAINKNDYTNAALHYYSHDNAITTNGVLNITTELKTNPYKAFNEKTKKYYLDSKHVQSGMIQGWNKFCYTGGIVEMSAKLPGDPNIGGLWPARECYACVARCGVFYAPMLIFVLLFIQSGYWGI